MKIGPATAQPKRVSGVRARGLALILAWAISSSNIFFEFYSSKGLTAIGDRGDGRFIVSIADHWNATFHGLAVWHSPTFFLPVPGVLGYSDGLLFVGLLRTFFGFFTSNSYTALMLSFITLSVVGFASMYVLLAFKLKVHRLLAAFCAMFFISFNGLVNISGHPQMLLIWVLPLFVFLMWPSNSINRKIPIILGTLAGLTLAGCFLTSFYVSWFFILVSIIVMLGLLLNSFGDFGARVTYIRQYLRTHQFRAFSISFSIGMIPFVLLYLPVIIEGKSRNYEETLFYALIPRDIFNIGPNNLMWSNLLRQLDLVPTDRLNNLELNNSPTPILFICALLLSVLVIKSSKIPLVLVAVSIFLEILAMKFGSFSLWRLIWEVPGASGIRAIGRVALFSNVLAILSMTLSANELTKNVKPQGTSVKRYVTFAIFVLILFEQVNFSRSFLINIENEILFENSFSDPPQSCEAFAVVGTSDRPGYLYQIDAMRLSTVFGIPTMNGYSGLQPEGWDLYQPQSPEYQANLFKWRQLMNYDKKVCMLNLDSGEWQS